MKSKQTKKGQTKKPTIKKNSKSIMRVKEVKKLIQKSFNSKGFLYTVDPLFSGVAFIFLLSFLFPRSITFM